MNSYPIFYAIHGQFFENSDSKQQKLKKITLIFENEKPKKLRKRALRKLNEIKQGFISKKRVTAPTYFTSKNNQNGTFIDSIENVPFFTNKTQLNLALTLSFGIKDAPSMYHPTNFTDYPYNKNLHPIIAIGKSLPEVEFTLQKNLIIEREYYKHYNNATPKIQVVENFIAPEILKDYAINSLSNNYRGFSNEFKMLKNTLKTNESEFFKTSQFYSVSIKSCKKNTTSSFLDKFKNTQTEDYLLKEAIFKKELKVLSSFYKKDKYNVDFSSLNKEKLRQYLILNIHFKSNFFSQKQMKLHLKMSEIISYKNEKSNEFHMKESIKKYL